MRNGTCGRCPITSRRRGRRALAGLAVALAALVFPATALAEPDFQLLVSPGVAEVAAGGETTLEVGVGAIDGFASPVQLSVSGLPPGVTGEFSVNPVTPSGVSLLVLRAEPSAALETVSPVVTGMGGGKTHAATGRGTADVRLLRVCRGTITGTARDEAGVPLPGVEIRVTPTPDTFVPPDATTGPDGRYLVESVPLQNRNEDREVSVFGNLLPDYWWGHARGTVGCGRTTQLDLTLVRVRPAQLLGTVFEGVPDSADYTRVIPTTTPAVGVFTYLFPLEDPLPFPVEPITTGADGRYDYRFPVRHDNAPLSTWLNALSPFTTEADRRSGYWDNSLALPDVQPGQVLERDIAVVPKCTFALTGRVVDAVTSSPLVGAEVQVSTFEDFDAIVSGSDGSFVFPKLLIGHNNEPTTLFAFASLLGYESAFVDVDDVGCADDQEVTLRLTPREYYFGTLEGTVRDEETRAPLAGIRVFLDFATMRCGTPPRLEAPCEAVTDADGRYRIGPILSGHEPDDVYHAFVRASSQAFPPQYYDASAFPVVRNGENTMQDLDMLRRRFATVAGTVRDATTKRSIAAARILVAEGGALSTGDGSYSVAGLHLLSRNAPKTANASASANGYWPWSIQGVQLVADTTTPVDVELMPVCQDATIAGRVLDEQTGQPIANAAVRIGPHNRVTDAGGNFEVAGVEVGNPTSPVLATVTAFKTGEYFAGSVDVSVFCGLRLTVTPAAATGSVVVRKTVSGAPPPAGRTFPFRLRRGAADGAPGTLVAEATAPGADGGPAVLAGLSPGAYELCEVVPMGWETSLTGFTLPGGEVCTAVTVSASAATAVDVDNTPPAVDPPPTCVIAEQGALPDGRGFIRFRAQDVGSGFASYTVVHVRNATVSVDGFSVGALGPVMVTATGVTIGKLAVTVEFLDLAGNKAVCDPIVHVVSRTEGQLEEETFTEVPQAESKVTILNGDPGMSKVRLVVNGVKFKEYDLAAGEVRKFDVAAAMRPGNDNTITVSVRGKKGATAVIVVADID